MAELNVDNRTIFVGDNLPVLRGINSVRDRLPHVGSFSGCTSITDPAYREEGKASGDLAGDRDRAAARATSALSYRLSRRVIDSHTGW